MTTPFFDDFWEASSLDTYSIQEFAQRMAAYDADHKVLRLEYPTMPHALPRHRSRLTRLAGRRKSERTFRAAPLTTRQLSKVLSAGYAAGGLEHRVYPAAGALYTIELFCVVFRAADFDRAVLYYDAESHGYLQLPGKAPEWGEAKERLNIEYTLPVDFEMSRFSVCRWISADDKAEVQRFIESHRGDIARDLDNDPVFLAQHAFSLNYEAERWKAIRFTAVKDYQVRDKAA